MELYQTALLYLLIFWLRIHNTWVRSKSKQHSDDETSRLVLVLCKYVKCANCETRSSVPYCKADPKTRRNMFRFCGEKFRLLFGSKALWQLDHSPMWLTDGATHNNRYFLAMFTNINIAIGWITIYGWITCYGQITLTDGATHKQQHYRYFLYQWEAQIIHRTESEATALNPLGFVKLTTSCPLCLKRKTPSEMDVAPRWSPTFIEHPPSTTRTMHFNCNIESFQVKQVERTDESPEQWQSWSKLCCCSSCCIYPGQKIAFLDALASLRSIWDNIVPIWSISVKNVEMTMASYIQAKF